MRGDWCTYFLLVGTVSESAGPEGPHCSLSQHKIWQDRQLHRALFDFDGFMYTDMSDVEGHFLVAAHVHKHIIITALFGHDD